MPLYNYFPTWQEAGCAVGIEITKLLTLAGEGIYINIFRMGHRYHTRCMTINQTDGPMRGADGVATQRNDGVCGLHCVCSIDFVSVCAA